MTDTQLLNYVTKHTSPNQSGDFVAEAITIHWWGEPGNHRGNTVQGVIDWLCNPKAEASANFVVSGKERTLACLVDLAHAAWHAADHEGNHRTVGIECRPFDDKTPPAEVEAELQAVAYTIALVWHWRPKTKNKPLKGHRDWASTECPGNYYPRLDDLVKRAQKIYPRVDPDRPGYLTDGSNAPTAPAKPKVSLSALIKAAKTDPGRRQGGTTPGAADDVRIVEDALRREGFLAKEWATDGSYGTKTVQAYSRWQIKATRAVGQGADGIPGSQSLRLLGAKYGFEVTK